VSGGGRQLTCTSCGRVGRHQARGLCPACYARSRRRVAVCIDCGELRTHHRGGRCSRCYAHARTTTAACSRCGRPAVLWGQTTVCRRCRNLARATGGACSSCRRTVARLWGGRCTRCAKRHWTTGSCRDCWAWTTSIATGGRCRACREFTVRNRNSAPCRSCGRDLTVNRYRRCRLCAASRREAHLAGDPDWKREPGARAGIQLFLGDVYRRAHRTTPGESSDSQLVTPVVAASGLPAAEQLALASMPTPRFRPTGPSPGPIDELALEPPAGLAAAVAACAQARGWKPVTTTGVLHGMAILTGHGSFELTETVIEALQRRRVPVTRVREFLAASGLTVDLPERPQVRWHSHMAGLYVQIRAEVAAWVEVLEGRWGRGRARTEHTIRHYLNVALPALAAWSASYHSLREVTTDDIVRELDRLHGSSRTITAIALRSLFAALKTRRLVFIDPARTVSPGRFPTIPVLGLDDDQRQALLGMLPRADHRLVVLLAGVHALTRADMIALQVDDINLDTATMQVRGRSRPLDRLTSEAIITWLAERRRRWPDSANPHLLVTYKSAYGLGPISTAYIAGIFKTLGTTAAGLRADRLLGEAHAHGDPLRLVRLFAVSPATAVRYCTEAGLDRATGDDPHGR
jgi:integrase